MQEMKSRSPNSEVSQPPALIFRMLFFCGMTYSSDRQNIAISAFVVHQNFAATKLVFMRHHYSPHQFKRIRAIRQALISNRIFTCSSSLLNCTGARAAAWERTKPSAWLSLLPSNVGERGAANARTRASARRTARAFDGRWTCASISVQEEHTRTCRARTW